MTLSNFKMLGKSRPSAAAGTQGQDTPPPKAKQGGLSAYGFLFLGLLLFTIGGMFNNAPLQGQHKLLVATSEMPTKELQKCVLFIVRHDRGGAQAFVVNKPGAKGQPGYGGPTERDKIYALQSLDVTLPETVAMPDAGIGLLSGKEAVDKLLAARVKPAWFVVVHGYAGWAAGQMEQEIHAGLWELIDDDSGALTSTPAPKLWDKARLLPRLLLSQ